MALIQMNLYSAKLGMSTDVNVIVPGGPGPHKTLYLLHGAWGGFDGWQRCSNIEMYAAQYGLAVVMPGVENSFYCDMAHGYAYFSYIVDELMPACQRLFHLSDKREDNFAAGLSMGGFGAFKLGLQRPQLFSYVASLSGAVDMMAIYRHSHDTTFFDLAFGGMDKVENSPDDFLWLLRQHKKNGVQIPRLYIACGTEDFLYTVNANARDEIRRLGFPLTYEEGPGGHDWAFWDKYIQRVLAWLPLCQQPPMRRKKKED